MSLIDPRARPSHRVRVALATIAMLGVTVASTGPAAAQQEPVPTPTTPLIVTESDADPAIDADSPVGQIIPGPNSGARPERPGDRGGSLQLGLFALLLLFMAVAAWRIAVTGRRGRAAHDGPGSHALAPIRSRTRAPPSRRRPYRRIRTPAPSWLTTARVSATTWR